ncbi:MAG: hypothetical protein ACI9TH_001721 [Kiritimatiellia bacterium]
MIRPVLLILFSLLAGRLQADGSPRAQLVNEIIEASGLQVQVEQVTQLVRMGFEQSGAAEVWPASMLAQYQGSMNRAYDHERMLAEISVHIQTNMITPDIDEVMAWLKSPLGKKISRLEAATDADAVVNKMAIELKTLMQDTDRVARMEALDEAMTASQHQITIARNTQIAILAAKLALVHPDNRPKNEVIQEQFNHQMERLAPLIRQTTVQSFVYTYRELNPAEIEDYIDFAKSRVGRAYHQAMLEGIDEALVKANRLMLASLQKMLNVSGK